MDHQDINTLIGISHILFYINDYKIKLSILYITDSSSQSTRHCKYQVVVIVPTSQHGPNLKIYPQNHILIVDAGRELTCSSQQDLQ